jgi:hypothetical protein
MILFDEKIIYDQIGECMKMLALTVMLLASMTVVAKTAVKPDTILQPGQRLCQKNMPCPKGTVDSGTTAWSGGGEYKVCNPVTH